MSGWRNIAALAAGILFAALAAYWLTIGRRPIVDAPSRVVDGEVIDE